MAERVIRQLIDDLDGSEIPEGGGERISFSIRGIDYQIDLSAGNAAKFDTALKPYLGAAKRIHGEQVKSPQATRGGRVKSVERGSARSTKTNRSRASRRAKAKVKSSPQQVAAVREWARKNGFTVADRGRISAEVSAAFAAAH
ncbi:histone-like nucleoid-structuring protein Lsr2 (plasmid) [Mycolicibacterium aichiense]|uniref:histone-like nucleoid-structuring protein Lsr2 n=1 Tax=Mycolicibacterium aichiense TaxID=1799 RepID=UPI003D66842E